jgi:hypothetical protein
MRRLCTEGACSYSGRAVQQAARVAMGIALRPMLKSMDEPSNPKVAVIATGAGLRATAKDVEHPPDPTTIRAAHWVVNTQGDRTAVSRRRSSPTPIVMGGTW